MKFSFQIGVEIKGILSINWNEELRNLHVEEATWDVESQMQELFGAYLKHLNFGSM